MKQCIALASSKLVPLLSQLSLISLSNLSNYSLHAGVNLSIGQGAVSSLIGQVDGHGLAAGSNLLAGINIEYTHVAQQLAGMSANYAFDFFIGYLARNYNSNITAHSRIFGQVLVLRHSSCACN